MAKAPGVSSVRDRLAYLEAKLNDPVQDLDRMVRNVRHLGNLSGDHAPEIVKTFAASINAMPEAGRYVLHAASFWGDGPMTFEWVRCLASAVLYPETEGRLERLAEADVSAVDDWAHLAWQSAQDDGCARLSPEGHLVVHTLTAGVARASNPGPTASAHESVVNATTSRLAMAAHNAAEHIKRLADGQGAMPLVRPCRPDRAHPANRRGCRRRPR